jgi:hypothetical protein
MRIAAKIFMPYENKDAVRNALKKGW